MVNDQRSERRYILTRMLNPENWLIYKKADGQLHLIYRHTNRVRVIPSA
ncbi:hypothetical protein P4278_16760 [Bacillus thuringiensis]|nr:hypothetical protein [Bacillus thuringiensis]MED2781333.1 hypothetical protein [Bacillus thuringiensis]